MVCSTWLFRALLTVSPIVAWLLPTVPVLGQEASPNSPVTQVATDDEVAAWIESLGSSRFEERQLAMNRLTGVGEQALPKLREALANCDQAEQQVRLRALITRLEEYDQRHRIESFIRETDPEKDYGMRAWPLFRDLVGSNRTSRRMFIEIYHSHAELADLLVDNPEGVAEASNKVSSSIRERMMTGQPLELGDGLTMLFIAACAKEPLPPESTMILRRSIYFQPLAEKMETTQWRGPLERLVGGWIDNLSDKSLSIGLELCQFYGMEKGATVARRALAQTTLDADSMELALFLLGEFGNPEDCEVLEPFLTNETLLRDSSVSDGVTAFQLERRLQDVALAGLASLKGEKLDAYFPYVKYTSIRGRTRIREETIGFPYGQAEARQAAIQRWKAAKKP